MDLFHGGPRNKETFSPSFTHLPDKRKQLLRASLEKKRFLLSMFNLCKTSVKGSHFSKIEAFFPGTFAKSDTVTGIFREFYPDFKQFCIACNIS